MNSVISGIEGSLYDITADQSMILTNDQELTNSEHTNSMANSVLDIDLNVSANVIVESQTIQEHVDEALFTGPLKVDYRKTSTPRKLVRCSEKGYDYITAYQGNLWRHTQSIHKKVHLSCDICDAKFSKPSELTKHLRIRHVTKLMCHSCSSTFGTESGLLKHVQRTHNEIRNFSCKMCPEQFSDKDSYTGHVNKHNDIKPYKCNTCSKSFDHPRSFRRHNKTCRGEETPAQCNECDKIYQTSQMLREHTVAKHTNQFHRCRCGKQFQWKQSYNRHIKRCRTYL